MRLTEVQVREAFQHSDKDVRFAALEYFAKSFSPNTEIMQDVIAVIERFGPKEAFAYSFPISALVQTEETVDWAIQRLQHRPSTEAETDFAAHLGQLLLNADPKLIVPHQTEILSLPGVDRKLASRMEQRLGFSSLPGEQLWQRLNAICEAGKDKYSPTDIPFAEAEEIAKALGRDVAHADRMMDLLRQEFDPESETPMTWLEIFLARMAGEMRYEPAVPLLVGKLLCDGEILSEECDSALTKIGTDSVIRAVREAYPQAPNYFRLYSSGLFGDIHSDLALSTGLELLSLELDPDQRTWLANALVDQFSTEAVDAARTVVLEESQDFCDLKSSLVVACKLMAYEVPELKQWERELAEPRQRSGRDVPALDFDDLQDFDDLDDESESLPTATRIGRNDPCPCGSGKKYKKCCINKPPIPR